MHGYFFSGLEEGLPEAWEHDCSGAVDEVVVALHDVGTDYVHVEECFLDDFCDALKMLVMEVAVRLDGTYRPSLATLVWESEFTPNSIFKFDGLDFRSKSHKENDEIIL